MVKNLFIVLEEEKDGGYSASVPALPGCFSQGDTLDEAIKNAKEAIDLYLENEKKIKSKLPKSEILVPYQIGA
jgi:antitoxin HicB